jgi:hypothetical protein
MVCQQFLVSAIFTIDVEPGFAAIALADRANCW